MYLNAMHSDFALADAGALNVTLTHVKHFMHHSLAKLDLKFN